MAIGHLAAVTLDCSDAKELANFYHAAVGLELVHSDDDGAYLSNGDGMALAVQRVEGYQPPQWPSQARPQQLHLDIAVSDLDDAEGKLISLGAKKAAEQPGGDRWRVFLDPAGHPFCVAIFEQSNTAESIEQPAN